MSTDFNLLEAYPYTCIIPMSEAKNYGSLTGAYKIGDRPDGKTYFMRNRDMTHQQFDVIDGLHRTSIEISFCRRRVDKDWQPVCGQRTKFDWRFDAKNMFL